MHSRYSRYREFGLLALVLVVASLGAATAVQAQGFRDQYEGRKKILIVGDLRTGNQIAHDGVGHAMGVLEQLGRKSGAYVSFLRSDTDLVTNGEVWGKGDYAKGGRKQAPGRNLDYFDAVVFYTNGDLEMSDQQKQDLLDFVRKDGKGFVAIHTAAVTMTNFPEYGEMIGGFFVNHPWNVFDAPVVNERPDSPIAKHLPKEFLMRDEMYQYKDPYSRDKVDVLLRLDARHLDLDNKNVQRTDGDFPIAWTKTYGKGRVFTSSLGHSDASWDDPRVQTLYLEAIKWVLRQTDDAVKPHPGAPLAKTGNYVQPSTPQGSGRYPAIFEVATNLKTHTVYRPANIKALGKRRMPIVVWANGACLNLGNRFRYFLTEIASHGYLAIAIGPPGSPAVEATSEAPLDVGEPIDPAARKPKTRSEQLIDAIDWAIAENTREGGALRARLDTEHIAVMGQSCGGLQAIVASADPRVTTTVVWNSGTFGEGANAQQGLPGASATKNSLAKLHAPIAYISGDASDIAHANANDDFARLPAIPAFRGYPTGVGHTGTYREPNGGEFAKVAVDWLDWQLRGDERAARSFVGSDCRLCRDTRWKVEQKNLR